MVLFLATLAGVATWRGADQSRRPLDARAHVQETVRLALTEGNRSAVVLDNLVQLRRELGLRPLDSKSRVQYAALLLSLTRRLEDARAASFHASVAADLAPVTLPVVELAALILARSGDSDEALSRVRDITGFDPEAGADLLLRLEENFVDRRLTDGVDDHPRAWSALAEALDDAGRQEESATILRQAETRWPEDLGVLVALSRIAVRDDDWAALERWTSRDGFPLEGPGLELLAFRARSNAESGQRSEAEADLATLLSRSQAPYHLLLAGDAQRRLDLIDDARRSWHRALFSLAAGKEAQRLGLLVRLADLEETDGRASVALRHWKEVLEIDPDHPRARSRIETLTGQR